MLSLLFVTQKHVNTVKSTNLGKNQKKMVPKRIYWDIDLHNNETGRVIGENNGEDQKDEMADNICQNIYSITTQFV